MKLHALCNVTLLKGLRIMFTLDTLTTVSGAVNKSEIGGEKILFSRHFTD